MQSIILEMLRYKHMPLSLTPYVWQLGAGFQWLRRRASTHPQRLLEIIKGSMIINSIYYGTQEEPLKVSLLPRMNGDM